MRLTDLARPAVLQQPVYEPGKPIEVAARELGLRPEDFVKLASNENPLGPSPAAVAAARAALGEAHRYPDNACWALRRALAARWDLPADHFVFGAGSNELITLAAAVFAGPGVEVVMARGAFASYKIATLLAGGTPVEVPLRDYAHDLPALAAAITPRTRLVFVASPNNPTGGTNPAAELLALAEALPPHVVLVADDAYAEFRAQPVDWRPCLRAGAKLLVLRTFSKVYGLGGLRVGYGVAAPELVRLLDRLRPPFNVSGPAQAAALAALGDEAWVARTLAVNAAGRAQLEAGLRALGARPVPGEGNFLLVEQPRGGAVAAELQRRGVIVRPLGGYQMPDHLRISIGTEPENARLLEAWPAAVAAATAAERS